MVKLLAETLVFFPIQLSELMKLRMKEVLRNKKRNIKITFDVIFTEVVQNRPLPSLYHYTHNADTYRTVIYFLSPISLKWRKTGRIYIT